VKPRWAIPQGEWEGETCVILAGGASLGNERTGVYTDLSAIGLAQARVITINDSWRLFPADVYYFCDASWWRQQLTDNKLVVNGKETRFADIVRTGFWVTAGPDPPNHPNVHALQLTGQCGFEPNPQALRHGSNSGYQAIHVAAHYGARRIVLLGYDMKVQPDGRTHWHTGPRDNATTFRHTINHSFLPHFKTLAGPLAKRGIEVINATPDSALTIWPYMPLDEALRTA
jgi:hypothetical protein